MACGWVLEFMGGTIVGMGIGYGIDWFFNSTPWGILVVHAVWVRWRA